MGSGAQWWADREDDERRKEKEQLDKEVDAVLTSLSPHVLVEIRARMRREFSEEIAKRAANKAYDEAKRSLGL